MPDSLKFYLIVFDFESNASLQSDIVTFVIERLRNYYMRNLIIPLGNNTFLAKELKDHHIEFYIHSAIDEVEDSKSIELSQIRYFLVPIKLEDISRYTTKVEKEIELMKQIN